MLKEGALTVMKTMISCIIPCYGSQKTIAAVVDSLKAELSRRDNYDYEIILVNDASPDDVMDVIVSMTNADSHIKALDLSRNFGQHGAYMAGINHAQGDIFIFMDDDGQTPPSQLWKLIDALDNTCDVVFGKYESKKHSIWRNICSGINDYMAQVLIGKPKNLTISSYFAFKKFVAREIVLYKGCFPYLSGLVLRTTKRIKNIPVEHNDRTTGTSGYTLSKLLILWMNGFTAFSIKPLRMAGIMGFLVSAIGFIYGLVIIIRRLFITPYIPLGWSSSMAALLFVGGMIMIILGMIGEYVGRIYMNINNAPQYVVRERIGFEDDK